jgi:hypothetical protein
MIGLTMPPKNKTMNTKETMDYSRASRENTHTVQRMRMEKSKVA